VYWQLFVVPEVVTRTDNIMAEFKLSSLGRYYVTDEGLTEVPRLRIAFVIITIILGVSVLLKLIAHFVSVQKLGRTRPQQKVQAILPAIFITHFISYAIHTIHYADNIYRPVDYLEPRWLYVKYIVSEMEITFTANFPISLMGLIGMQGLMTAIKDENGAAVRLNCKRLIFYTIGSLLTLGHYRTEFPSHYSAFVNFTIAGEGIVTILFAFLLWKCWQKFYVNVGESLNLEIDDEVSGKLLDFYDDENRSSTLMKDDSKSKVRSRTPVRSDQ